MPEFQYYRPHTLTEALRLARECGEDFDYIAGGTDLLQNYKNRLNHRGHVISLAGLPELREISPTCIGALATLDDLAGDEAVHKQLPAVAAAAGRVASPLVRMSATVGGNILVETRCFWFNQTEFWRRSIGNCLKADGDVCRVVPQQETCYATYSGDLAPVLMALGASLRLVGWEGEREVPLREFFRGDGIARNVKHRDEIISHILIPEAAGRMRAGYRKLRVRDAFDYPELGVAGALLAGRDGAVEELHVVLSAVHPTPTAYPEVTDRALGQPLTPELRQAIAAEIQARSMPVRNTAMAPSYRKKMVGVHVRRLLDELAASDQ